MNGSTCMRLCRRRGTHQSVDAARHFGKIRRHEETMMRAVLTASLAMAALGLCTSSLPAAPTGIAWAPKAAPLTQLVQGNYYGGYAPGFGFGYGYDYKPACPANYHYSCW